MYIMNILRPAACSAILALAVASSSAFAAQGDSCTARVAGPQGQSGATIGKLDADGKCVVKSEAKSSGSASGLEASAQCKDLSFSYSKKREGACAKHGGVLEWLAQG
ncbi:DUF3761 domain-containing protein [Dokdonella fugitiva]|jgi:hypothetical protein|uniref:DUF3761 domain-containing protein n=1 Tax=Dokdonella fugitiva TaxID=328517 RepID=UPI0015FA4D9D|nr:DUF3761 domain-containing protein [Dokdonella fugitiva]MBA8884353.1 hypothetical protein [Dokdonella fugitiva]